MARVGIDDFGEDAALERVALAANMREARRIEAILDELQLDYAVEIEPFVRTILFIPLTYQGAAFYVPEARAEDCRARLGRLGQSRGLD